MEPAYINELALLARLNRKLTPRDMQIKRCPEDSPRYPQLGRFYHIATPTGEVLTAHVDIEDMARKVGALRDWEYLER